VILLILDKKWNTIEPHMPRPITTGDAENEFELSLQLEIRVRNSVAKMIGIKKQIAHIEVCKCRVTRSMCECALINCLNNAFSSTPLNVDAVAARNPTSSN
jgi:hypothetical protein